MAAIQAEEMKIPVFSVLKNGIVLKNIFLNNPNWEILNETQEQEDEFMLIGRHPDCQIVLDHPSISRFHLKICVNPTLQKLVILDRDSVHGTWVCGKKIEPNVEINLNEGDILRLGGSSRLYKLHWVSMRCAFEMENPLPVVLEETEEMNQQNSPSEKCGQDVSLCINDLSSKAKDIMEQSSADISNLNVQKFEAVDSSLPKDAEDKIPEKSNNANDLQYEDEYKSPSKSGSLLSRRSKSKSISSLSVQTGRKKIYETEKLENDAQFDSKGEENDEVFNSDKENMTPFSSRNLKTLQKSSVNVSATSTMREDGKEDNDEVFNPEKENITPFSSRNLKIMHKSSLNVSRTSTMRDNKEKVENDTTLCRALFDSKGEENDEVFNSDKENKTPFSSKNLKTLQKSSLDASTTLTMREDSEEDNDEVFNSDKENMTPFSSRNLKIMSKSSPNVSRTSTTRDSKENFTTMSKDLFLVQEEENIEALFQDKENTTPLISRSNKSKKALLMDFDTVDADEAISSETENVTPAVSESRKLKKAPLIDFEYSEGEAGFFSDKENVTPVTSSVKKSKGGLTDSQMKIESLIKERRKERIPLMPLFGNSPYRSPVQSSHKKCDKERLPFQSVLNSPLKNSSPLRSVGNKERSFLRYTQNSPINDKGNKLCSFRENELINSPSESIVKYLSNAEESRKKWIMVADTDCFLKEESRKSLQLLEGLRGTQLIIPRIVIRELDCLKRRERFYRNGSKIASSVLKWIEECMVKWSWWIHVQSSLETMPVAPTPPATPCSTFGNRSFSNSPRFSTCGSLMEVLSPTAEDHIVDCGLLFKKIRDDGHLVLLTESVTLRIKAMTEGLLCEKPSEFRESLVNPYSKRFLWQRSSPRAWSCFDDAELICDGSEKFPDIRNKEKATVSSSFRGLKLILLNNSQDTKAGSV